jgi:hypothetical protein
MMTGDELDDAFARHVVDDIVLPLLAGRGAPSKSTRLKREESHRVVGDL